MICYVPGLYNQMTRSTIVTWLRLLLPLIALALLSVLFLFSREAEIEPQIPYSQYEAERQADRPSVVAPQMATVTEDGTQLTLRAEELVPAQSGDKTIEKLRLDVTRSNGMSAEVVAPKAAVQSGQISLTGGADMTTSTGWSIRAESIDADIETSNLAASSGVKARAPFGHIEAGRMELRESKDNGAGSAVLNFTDGVRLIYQP